MYHYVRRWQVSASPPVGTQLRATAADPTRTAEHEREGVAKDLTDATQAVTREATNPKQMRMRSEDEVVSIVFLRCDDAGV